jgi:hypothetical protein
LKYEIFLFEKKKVVSGAGSKELSVVHSSSQHNYTPALAPSPSKENQNHSLTEVGDHSED